MIAKKKTLIIGLLSAAFITATTFSSATLAKYIESKSVGQTVSREGPENISIFLNPNVWTQGTDNSGNIVDPVYYLWVVFGASEGKLVTPTRHVTPTVSTTIMDLYVFEYTSEWATNSRKMVFIRANPDTSISDYSTWPADAVWNQTCDVPYNSERNYYCIKGWDGATDGKSKYEYNRIDKDGATLTWGNPTGANTIITT